MLETERLILRKWTEEDAESLFEYAKDPEIGPAAGWPPHKSVEESRAVIKNVFDGAECYAICEKEKNIAIGAVELKLNGYTNKLTKIGIKSCSWVTSKQVLPVLDTLQTIAKIHKIVIDIVYIKA